MTYKCIPPITNRLYYVLLLIILITHTNNFYKFTACENISYVVYRELQKIKNYN